MEVLAEILLLGMRTITGLLSWPVYALWTYGAASLFLQIVGGSPRRKDQILVFGLLGVGHIVSAIILTALVTSRTQWHWETVFGATFTWIGVALFFLIVKLEKRMPRLFKSEVEQKPTAHVPYSSQHDMPEDEKRASGAE